MPRKLDENEELNRHNDESHSIKSSTPTTCFVGSISSCLHGGAEEGQPSAIGGVKKWVGVAGAARDAFYFETLSHE